MAHLPCSFCTHGKAIVHLHQPHQVAQFANSQVMSCLQAMDNDASCFPRFFKGTMQYLAFPKLVVSCIGKSLYEYTWCPCNALSFAKSFLLIAWRRRKHQTQRHTNGLRMDSCYDSPTCLATMDYVLITNSRSWLVVLTYEQSRKCNLLTVLCALFILNTEDKALAIRIACLYESKQTMT